MLGTQPRHPLISTPLTSNMYPNTHTHNTYNTYISTCMLLRVGTPIFQILGVVRRLFWWQVGYGFKFSFCHRDRSLLFFCVKAVKECRYQVNLSTLYVCILGVCMPLCACAAWRTAYRRQFSLSTMWVMGIELGSLDVLSGLVSFCFQLGKSLDFCGKGI